MTAFPAFQLLECEGRYSPAPDAPPQSVVVKFGDASLVIMTFADIPIAHWPLASLARERHGPRLVLAPDPAAPERLEIDDTTMIDAIAQVCRDAPLRGVRGRRRWRARAAVALALIAALAVGATIAAPMVLTIAGERLPQAARARLGAASLAAHAGAALCEAPPGRRALDALAPLLTPAGMPVIRLSVAAMPPDHPDAIAAPGGQILLTADAVASARQPVALADAVAIAIAEAAARRRTALAMQRAGLVALPALVTGRMDHPRLVATVVEDLRAGAPHTPETTAEAAALAARMPSITGRGARPLGASEWRTVRTLCDAR